MAREPVYREKPPALETPPMNALILSVALLAQAPETPKADPAAKTPATASLDGNWTVVCYEKNGQPMAEAKDCQVMVKDNVATFTCKNEKDKIMSIRIECGEKGTIRATELADAGSEKPGEKVQTKTGVCVKTQEYVAICIHDAGGEPKTGTEPGTKAEQPANAETKAYCTVILKRAGGNEGK